MNIYFLYTVCCTTINICAHKMNNSDKVTSIHQCPRKFTEVVIATVCRVAGVFRQHVVRGRGPSLRIQGFFSTSTYTLPFG